MESLGISKEILMWLFAILISIFTLLFAFIYVGIKAKTIPRTFGIVDNNKFLTHVAEE